MLLPIINLLLSGSVQKTVARSKRTGIFLAVIAVLVLTAYAFALVALSAWLTTLYGPIGQALVIAAGALLLAVILVAVMMIINRQEQERQRERRAAVESMAAAAIGLVRTQPLLTVAVAAAFLLTNMFSSSKRDD